jgi:ketosteroid isomerase-like protein
MKKVPSISFALIALVIATPLVLAQKSAGKNSRQDALLKTDVEFARASVEKGVAAAFAIYLADDAMQMPVGANPIFGKKDILAGMGSGYVLTWEPKKAEVAKSGDLGWTWGTYELRTMDGEGKPIVRYGKYVNVWRRQKDGTWKVILDMGNASPAPAPK